MTAEATLPPGAKRKHPIPISIRINSIGLVLARLPLVALVLDLLSLRPLSADCPPPVGSLAIPGRVASVCKDVGPLLSFEYRPLEGQDYGLVNGATWSQISFEPSAFIGLVRPGRSGSALSFPNSALQVLEDRKGALVIQKIPGGGKPEYVVGRVDIGPTITATTPGFVVSAQEVYEFHTMDLADGTTILLREGREEIDMIAMAASGDPAWSLLIDTASILQASGMDGLSDSFIGNDSKDGSRFYLFAHGWVRVAGGADAGSKRSVGLVMCFNGSGSLRWSRRFGIPEMDPDWFLVDDAVAPGEGLLLLIGGQQGGEASSVLLSIAPDGDLSWSGILNHPFWRIRSMTPTRALLIDEEGAGEESHSLFAVFDAAEGFLRQERFSEPVFFEGVLDDLGRILLSAEDGRVIGVSSEGLLNFKWKRYLGPASLDVDVDADRKTLTYLSQPVGSDGDPFEWLESGFDVVVLDENLEARTSCELFQEVPGPRSSAPTTLKGGDARVEWDSLSWEVTATPPTPRRMPLVMEEFPLLGTSLCTVLDARPRFDATVTSDGRLQVSFISTPGLLHSLRAADSILGDFREIRSGIGTGERVSFELEAPPASLFFRLIELSAP